MDEHPKQRELRHAYAQRPFSVFAVSRQVKLPGEQVRYSTIHSAMIFPVCGRARFALDGEALIGERGRVLHGCPHRLLLFEALGNEPFEHINIYYEAGENNGSDPRDLMGRSFDYEPGNYEELLARVEALEILGKTPSLENRLNQIVGATSLLKSMFDTSPRQRTSERMARVRAHLETHFAERLTLHGLAELAGMSEQRLSYCFMRAYGIRPMNFLIARRLEEAGRLLQSGASVKNAAQAVGYDDPLYFSRLFKKHYGYPPTAAQKRAGRPYAEPVRRAGGPADERSR